MLKKYLAAIALGLVCLFPVQASGSHAKDKVVKPKKPSVELQGYCPVAYYKMNKAVMGKPEFKVTYQGKTYQFVKKMAIEIFKKDPEAFLPVDLGNCIVCKIKSAKEVVGDPEVFSIYKKKLYFFATKKQKEMFDAKPESFVGPHAGHNHGGSHSH
jgi:YHS domain-containing protein